MLISGVSSSSMLNTTPNSLTRRNINRSNRCLDLSHSSEDFVERCSNGSFKTEAKYGVHNYGILTVNFC